MTDERALLADLLADPSTWAEPSARLEDAIVRAVEAAPPAARPSRTRPATDVRAHTTRRRRLAAALGAAAAAISLFGGVLAVSGGGGSSAEFAARLGATAVAPHATASATISKSDAGFRVSLHAHGLARLHDGKYYAAWLKNRAGSVVPLGTFSSSDGTVTLWSGVSPASSSTISVTVQPAGNPDASSGVRVLVGRVTAR
jgi:hypothetical protein